MTGLDVAVLDDEAAQLAQQLKECHSAIMRTFEVAAQTDQGTVRFGWEAMQVAGKMMRASATAAIALKRLRSDSDQGRHHTFTYVREGTPDSKKLKTNGDGVAGEAGGGAADAQAAA